MASFPIEEGDAAVLRSLSRLWYWSIAPLQIIGGLWGLYEVMFEPLIGVSRIVLLPAFVLFGASVWGGVLLALGKPIGVTVSLVIQGLQVLQICTMGLLYSFVSGVQILLGIRLVGNDPDMTGGLAS